MRSSPNDNYIFKTNNSFSMLRVDNYLNRYPVFLNYSRPARNNTDDLFNHYPSLGGYKSDGNTIKKGYRIDSTKAGGNFEVALPMTQKKDNETTNNPYPVVNA